MALIAIPLISTSISFGQLEIAEIVIRAIILHISVFQNGLF